jgi:hypothetical protein
MAKLFVFILLAMNHYDWPNTYKIQTRPQEKLCRLPNIHDFLKYEFLYPLATKQQVPTSKRTLWVSDMIYINLIRLVARFRTFNIAIF